METENSSRQINVMEAKSLIEDLYVHKPLIYWVDFLFYVTLAWTTFVFTLTSTHPLAQLAFTVVSALSFYRAVIFIHELAHQKKDRLQFFRVVWNLFCGFPLMVPSFIYQRVHIDHHAQKFYGTAMDGEYRPFVKNGRLKIVLYLLESFALPPLFVVRFLILSPIVLLIPPSREFIWQKLSSLAIDLSYVRRLNTSENKNIWLLQEFCAFLYIATAVYLVIAGLLTYKVFILWYIVGATIFLLNGLRTICAHCYHNAHDNVLGISGQYLDSVNVPGHIFFTAIWAPVGLRYHATHHLFPALPYHALGEAHRRLSRSLSNKEVYRETERKSLWDAFKRIWRDAGASIV